MARRRRAFKGHPIFFRNLTIFGAALGILGSTTFAGVMGVDAARGDLITDEVREYTASFSSEGSVLTKGTYKRGEELEIPQNPEHSIDGESNYFFVGWDTNSNGIPDYIPKRAYYSFNAEAVYFRTGKFDLDFLDLLNMDLEDLLQLLQDLNIDWEQFMSMFNIDPEMLMDWLMSQTVLTFETDPASSQYPTYFRSSSYGDFDYAKKSFKAPDFYDSSLISDNSVNPLSYTAYKLNKLDEMGLLPYGFGFTNYDITFNAVEDYYPVPDCESSNSMNEFIDSDAHYIDQPIDNFYQASAAYCPAFGYVIDLFNAIPLTGVVGRDEKAYYKYALENYTAIPQEYESVIDGMIEENDWYEEELYQVDAIAAYVSGLGQCSLFNDDGSVDINSYMDMKKKSSDPVMDLINDRRGSDLDFNTTAVMLFRRLNIPARLVKGYVSIGSQPGENSITLFNQHYWCEIYVKGTGWMICDCMDMTNILGTNPYEGLVKENTPLENNHILERISVTPPAKTEYYVGEPLEIAGGSLTAYFSDDTTSRMRLNASGVSITGFDSSTPGPRNVTVSYTYEEVTKSDRFQVVIKEQNATLTNVVFNFDYAKKEYYVGETRDTSNITATAYYDDGSSVNVSNKLTYSGIQYMDSPGTYDIVAYYTENGITFSDFYVVTVQQDYPTSLEIVTPPAKTKFFVGEKLLLDGLKIRIGRESGKYDEITYTGSVEDLQTNEVEFSVYTFDHADTNYEVVVRTLNNKTFAYVQDSFFVQVDENNLVDSTANNFKTSYRRGEYFDIDEFKASGYITGHLANGYTVRIYENYPSTYDTNTYDLDVQTTFTVTPPSLESVGNSTATVSFTFDGANYNVPITINVSEIDTNSFVFESDESGTTAGPGATGLSNSELFTYTTSHVGTVYFRNRSFNNYWPGGWSDSANNSSLSYSPNRFTFEKASQVYNSDTIDINYSSNMPNGVIPYYSNAAGQDNYQTSGTATAGSWLSCSFTNFELTTSNLRRLSSSYIPYSSTIQSNYNTYVNNYLGLYGGTINTDAYLTIENYINRLDHDYRNMSTEDIIVNVKNDLHNEFTLDPGFRYTDPSIDPVLSFFNQGTGGSKTFATAATLIYRQLGLYARYVTGFGSYSNGGTTAVTTRNAHAWCEVFYPNIGWIVVDPTGLDNGDVVGTLGEYSAGFGGSGLGTFDKPIYSGQVTVSYDYGSQFTEDLDADVDDPARWYTVYDDTDHHKIATFATVAGSDTLPSYLEIHVFYDWYRNGEYIGQTIGNSSSEMAPSVSFGQYELRPRLEIYDKSAGEYVTSDHNYSLAPGTENMEFFIQPAFVYVYVIGTQDSYSMNGNPSIILYTGQYSDIYFTTNVPEDIAALGIYDELPSTTYLVITGSFYYEGEGGTIIISYDNIDVDDASYTYTGQYQWDEFNVITVLYFGEVVINP